MKTDLLYVDHILECIQRIDEYVGGMSDSDAQARFMASPLIQDAVIPGVDVEFVWSVVAYDLPMLRESAIRLRARFASRGLAEPR